MRALTRAPATGHSQQGAARTWRGPVAALFWNFVLPLAVLAVLVGAWDLAIHVFDVKSYILPSPGQVWRSAKDNRTILWDGVKTTGKEIVVGFAVAVGIALPVGIALGQSAILQRVLVPLLVIAQIVPKVALAPLMIVWFGLDLSAKVIFVVLLCFFPVIVNTMAGVAAASADFRRLARSVGLGKWATLVKVTLPQALPNVFAGLKIAITLAVIGAVVAEFITSQSGLGFLILTAQGQVDTPLLFASILVLTVLGLALYGLVAMIGWLVMPWNRSGEVQ